MNKYKTAGQVLCKCGGILISIDGKVQLSSDYQLKCWKCGATHLSYQVFNVRKPNSTVIYYDNFGNNTSNILSKGRANG